MIGISYFAMTQLEAAVERPPHLKAILPVAASTDRYEAAQHHGLFNATFCTPFLAMIGVTSRHGDKLWRGKLANAARRVLNTPRLHEKFATMNGEASVGLLKQALVCATTRIRGTTCGVPLPLNILSPTSGGMTAT